MAARKKSGTTPTAASPPDADFERTAPLFDPRVLRTRGRLQKAERALGEARLSKRARTDVRWAARAIAMLGVVLPYPSGRYASGLHDEAAQLLLEMKPDGAARQLVALLAEPLAPHHRIVYLLGSLGDHAVVAPLCEWFEAKDSAGSNGVMHYVWDALVAIGGRRTSAALKKRLESPRLNRHHRWAYSDALERIRLGEGRPNRVGSILGP
jgi:hypothetical protein